MLRYNVIMQIKPTPQVEDVIGAALLNIMFMQKYMLENQVIENIL